MPNISILAADTVIEPDDTFFVPAAKLADTGSYKVNLPQPADTEPRMNGEVDIGTSKTWARADHVHPPNTAMLDTMREYVDTQNSALQEQISSLAQNLRFVGQVDVVADNVKFTSGSGITPSPGPLPTASPDYIGFYVIVVVAGQPPAGSNIPTDDYVMHDWIVCDGAVWQRLDVGATASTASTTAVTPAIAGMDDVQEVLEVLYADMPLASETVPLMDGVASVGTSDMWSPGDHVHPTDTSRYAASNPAGYVDHAGAAAAAPVQSVAGRPGAVTLTHTDITDWTATLQPYALSTTVPLPSSTVPKVAGTAATGIETNWSRGDHVHPVDNSRLPRKGVVDGSSAAAGDIGEYIVMSNTTGVAMVTNVAASISSIALTAGDWEIWGAIDFRPAAGVSPNMVAASISVTPNALPSDADLMTGVGILNMITTNALTSGQRQMLMTGQCRSNSATPITLYLVGQVTLGGAGALNGKGYICARRVR
jgi:hypothetical protein